jgi:hypothetical protein
MKVGDFGIYTAIVGTDPVLDNYTAAGNYITPISGVTPLPTGWASGRMVLTVSGGPSSGYHRQELTGTGLTNANRYAFRYLNAGAPGPWVELYNNRNVVGTVSQSAGIPTGAIVERGSNANGEYIKFADGTLICTRNVTINLLISSALAGGFRSSGQGWTYPAGFTVAPSVSGALTTLNGMGVSFSAPGTASASFVATAVTSQAAADVGFNLQAIGRWY